jgi:hypothetical protein
VHREHLTYFRKGWPELPTRGSAALTWLTLTFYLKEYAGNRYIEVDPDELKELRIPTATTMQIHYHSSRGNRLHRNEWRVD